MVENPVVKAWSEEFERLKNLCDEQKRQAADDRMVPVEWDDPNCPGCGKLGNLDHRLVNEPGGDFAVYYCSTSDCRVVKYEGGYSLEAVEEPRVFLTSEGQRQLDRRRLDAEVLGVVGKP